MLKGLKFAVLIVLCFGPPARAAVEFYSNRAAFEAAAGAAGISLATLDFGGLAPADGSADFSTAGLTLDGVDFFGTGLLQAQNTDAFDLGTGDEVLVGLTEIEVTLPGGVRAAGTNIGASFVKFVGGATGEASLGLTSGGMTGAALSTQQLFPFLGFISDTPVASLRLRTSGTFITIDGFSFGPVVPEPRAWALMVAGLIGWLGYSRYRRAI